ncbi:short chain dehydrogenase domain-containing protein [Trichoderma breve]|uniref:Short chain dehydrogenase domain-containing protein n=1 Tax=Trichoderma breve TaxID=2034170 RepID=A0A9W9BGA4_9HYPO|nr:short chain dehydrogenase domain-containing protein [Trichoderma breve]KAJ4859845.1 short chain dehydrogenase domain-containing protein [Trichoderma breve]
MATSHPEFSKETEGLDVAKAFSDGIRNKTIIVTGANRNGIGFSTCHAFASQSPACLILAGRNVDRIQECIDAIKQDFPDVNCRALKVDLSSQKSVRAAAAEVLAWSDVPAIDILVNSAGVMCPPERTLSVDGLEMHFATNHIGHWLFTCLIMPKLIKSAEGKPKGTTRIVNVTSLSPTVATMRWKAWGFKDCEDKAYVPIDGYNRSKVANVLFSIGATKRLYEKYGILSLAVHPGVMPTDLGRAFTEEQRAALDVMRAKGMFLYQTLGSGASTSLVAALDPKLKAGETVDGKENYGSSEAERLWALSEDLVKEKFSW